MTTPATSGTYTYNQSAIEILAVALRKIGAIAENEVPTSAIVTNCLTVMNGLVKAWSAAGIRVWCQQECILFLQPKQNQYQLGVGSPDNACLFRDMLQTSLSATAAAGATSVTLASVAGIVAGSYVGVQLDAGTNFWTMASGAPTGNVVPLTAALPSQATSGAIGFSYVTPLMRPLRVPEGRNYLYSSQIEIPLIPLARFGYDYLPNKFNTGVVTQFFFDPQMGNGSYSNAVALMNVWPSPQDNTRAMRFVAQRQIQDITAVSQLLDMPAEWLMALQWNMALEMAMEFDVPADRFDRVQSQASKWYSVAAMWDKEPEGILFGVATQPGYRT